MSNVVDLPQRCLPFPDNMTREQLLHEVISSERDLMAYEDAHDELARVLWPDGAEAPASYVDEGVYEMSDLAAGVQSLQELTDRLTAENQALRARIAFLEAQCTFGEDLHA